MDNSRPSSPDAPPQDLWSSILDSVSKSRSIPAKQVLVLGQPSTGKSTLISALLKKASADPEKEDLRSDFALGYDWADVKDDADEGGDAIFACLERRYSYSVLFRYPRKTIRIHSAVGGGFIYFPASPFPPASYIPAAHGGDHRARLDKTLDVCG